MENHKQQEANRQRMRELAQRHAQQESLKHKTVVQPPPQQHQRQPMQAPPQSGPIMINGVLVTELAFYRECRQRTASVGDPPVFNEKIWAEKKGNQGPSRRSVSPKTVRGTGKGSINMNKSSTGGKDQLKTPKATDKPKAMTSQTNTKAQPSPARKNV